MDNKRFLTAQDVMEMLDVSLSYTIVLQRCSRHLRLLSLFLDIRIFLIRYRLSDKSVSYTHLTLPTTSRV